MAGLRALGCISLLAFLAAGSTSGARGAEERPAQPKLFNEYPLCKGRPSAHIYGWVKALSPNGLTILVQARSGIGVYDLPGSEVGISLRGEIPDALKWSPSAENLALVRQLQVGDRVIVAYYRLGKNGVRIATAFELEARFPPKGVITGKCLKVGKDHCQLEVRSVPKGAEYMLDEKITFSTVRIKDAKNFLRPDPKRLGMLKFAKVGNLAEIIYRRDEAIRYLVIDNRGKAPKRNWRPRGQRWRPKNRPMRKPPVKKEPPKKKPPDPEPNAGVEAAARKKGQALLAQYDALVKAGKWKEARAALNSGKKTIADSPEPERSDLVLAGYVLTSISKRMKARNEALGRLKGREVELKTRSGGVTRGKVLEANEEAIKLKVTYVIRGTEASTTRTVKVADLALGTLDKLAPQLKPYAHDNCVAAGLMELVAGRPEQARKYFGDAGDHRLAKRYLAQMKQAVSDKADAAAERDWKGDLQRYVKKTYDARSAQALVAAVERFLRDHSASAFAKGKAAEITALRTAARKVLSAKVYSRWPFTAQEARRRQTETARQLGLPREKTLTLANGVKFTMVLIPAGEFMRGSHQTPKQIVKRCDGVERSILKIEHPRHKVRLTKPYYMGKYEVTQDLWEAITGKKVRDMQGARKPAHRISWLDSQKFLKKLNARFKDKLKFRLPTEAEWENACRAGTATSFYTGEGFTRAVACYNARRPWDGRVGRGASGPMDVGKHPANQWGLCDMYGNVSEWCQDKSGLYSKEMQTDPKGPALGTRRVMRGGAWWSSAIQCRSASRLELAPQMGAQGLGMRVASDVPLEWPE